MVICCSNSASFLVISFLCLFLGAYNDKIKNLYYLNSYCQCWICDLDFSLHCMTSLKKCFHLFQRKNGRGRDRNMNEERESSITCLLICPTVDRVQNLSICPDWEWNHNFLGHEWLLSHTGWALWHLLSITEEKVLPVCGGSTF